LSTVENRNEAVLKIENKTQVDTRKFLVLVLRLGGCTSLHFYNLASGKEECPCTIDLPTVGAEVSTGIGAYGLHPSDPTFFIYALIESNPRFPDDRAIRFNIE
jgi:hypothetical protein